MSNQSLELSVGHCGPHLTAAETSCLVAQLSRYAAQQFWVKPSYVW